MKIGLRIPCYRKWCRADEVRAIAIRAEERGFDSLWVQDHLVAPVGTAEETRVGGISRFMSGSTAAPAKPMTLAEYYAGDDWWLDPYIIWAYVAAVTTRVTLASDILVLPYRNPLVQAKMLGTLDVMSNGRMMIGTGIGHVEAEARALATDYAARGRAHDEYIRIIRAVLGSEETSFDGEFYSFGPLRTLIRPVQPKGIPIYTGGNGPRAMRRAIELGDGWLPAAPDPEGLANGIEMLRAMEKEMGRMEPLPIAVSLPSRIRLAVPGAPSGKSSLMSADEATAILKQYEALGVDHISLGLLMPNVEVYLQQIDYFADQVLPHFRD